MALLHSRSSGPKVNVGAEGTGRESNKATPLLPMFGPKYLQLKGIRQSPAGVAFSVTALVQGIQVASLDSMLRVVAALVGFEPLQKQGWIWPSWQGLPNSSQLSSESESAATLAMTSRSRCAYYP